MKIAGPVRSIRMCSNLEKTTGIWISDGFTESKFWGNLGGDLNPISPHTCKDTYLEKNDCIIGVTSYDDNTRVHHIEVHTYQGKKIGISGIPIDL